VIPGTKAATWFVGWWQRASWAHRGVTLGVIACTAVTMVHIVTSRHYRLHMQFGADRTLELAPVSPAARVGPPP
jgi:hypothetical protein